MAWRNCPECGEHISTTDPHYCEMLKAQAMPPPIPPSEELSKASLVAMLYEARMATARLEGYIDRVKGMDPPRPDKPQLVSVAPEAGLTELDLFHRIEGKLRSADGTKFEKLVGYLSTEEIEAVLRAGDHAPGRGFGGTPRDNPNWPNGTRRS